MPAASKPGRDCPRCPRLVAFRKEWRRQEPDWFNGPVPSFGPLDAHVLIVGLAPGVQGANRTGRPFTGDYAGVLLYETLAKYGFTRGEFKARPDDGLELIDCRITNAVRCVPPENKPLPVEIHTSVAWPMTACSPRWRRRNRRIRSAMAAVMRSARSRCFPAITARVTTRTPAC